MKTEKNRRVTCVTNLGTTRVCDTYYSRYRNYFNDFGNPNRRKKLVASRTSQKVHSTINSLMLWSPFLGKRKYEHPSRLSDFSADISKTNRISIDILRTTAAGQAKQNVNNPFHVATKWLSRVFSPTYLLTFLTDTNETFQINKVEKKTGLHFNLKVQKVCILCELFSM